MLNLRTYLYITIVMIFYLSCGSLWGNSFATMHYIAQPHVNAADYVLNDFPSSAPWRRGVALGENKKPMAPALRQFVRFTVITVGTFPIAFGTSMLIIPFAAPAWSTGKQIGVGAISATGISLVIAMIDMIIDIVLHNRDQTIYDEAIF
jgi:hypothetical protein